MCSSDLLASYQLILEARGDARDCVLVARVVRLRDGRRDACCFYGLAEEPGGICICVLVVQVGGELWGLVLAVADVGV